MNAYASDQKCAVTPKIPVVPTAAKCDKSRVPKNFSLQRPHIRGT
jgi:hypothetical protein